MTPPRDLAIARFAERQHGLEGELLAAVLAAGPGALLSHWAAAELHGLTPYRASLIDVVVPSKRRSPRGAKYHRTTIHWRDRTDRKHIPVTSVARLLVDLTDVVTIAHEITAVIREAAYHRTYSPLATMDARQRANGRKRIALLDEAIALYEAGSAGTRSKEEIRTITRTVATTSPWTRSSAKPATT